MEYTQVGILVYESRRIKEVQDWPTRNQMFTATDEYIHQVFRRVGLEENLPQLDCDVRVST